ncbi:helix-turn-helix transcriptional regulator [Cryptosporangium aurantiacum]|uniref:Helix-turn-helix domain-containing protein n=1 Tax=Cryptosporangium aurantiacum TaxID=134849 RepID=A0A1M7QR02_9ACTN|nr:helix-turn-helix domain-containing protein [Cryptosporangium aurantiacum]SHN34061.1 Helix-turn-helix domain-containing protein [Cryptosporangium aurantiacum]
MTPVIPIIDRLWSVTDTSTYLGVPVGTLYQWHHRRIGPPAYKVGRRLKYDPAEVRSWLRQQVA